MRSLWNRLTGRSPAVAPGGAYAGLRNQALGMAAEQLSVPDDKREAVLGLVTDWGMDSGVCTIVCFASGDASIYLQTGGGVIGGVAHESVRLAARGALDVASQLSSNFKPATEHPVPPRGVMRFALVTTKGTYAASAPVSELAKQQHTLTPLGNAVQMLITRLRENTPAA